VPDEKIERIRSLLAHAHEEEKVDPSPVQDSSRMSYAASADEIERLRSLFAHAHDPERTNPFRRLVSRLASRFTPRAERLQQPGKNKDAA
jgi:hypothetical protein